MDEFSALIEYIQTGSCVITPQTVVGLACAAEYYQVDELVDLCERSCQQMCDIRNVREKKYPISGEKSKKLYLITLK